MNSDGFNRKNPRMPRNQQGPQAPRMGAGEKPHPGRHSSGGDLRGSKPRAGSKAPASTSGRRVRAKKMDAAMGRETKPQHMAGPKGTLPKEKSIVSHYIRLGKALVETTIPRKSGGGFEPKTTNPQKGVAPTEKSLEGRGLSRAQYRKRMMAANGVKPTEKSQKEKSVEANESLYFNIGKVIAEGLGLVSESDKSPASVAAAQREREKQRRLKNVKAQQDAADEIRAKHPEKAKPTKIGDVDREKAKAAVMASDRKKFPGSRP